MTIERILLDNGLKVAIAPSSDGLFAMNLYVNHGSLHEDPEQEGIAHLIEHNLMAGGTKTHCPETVKRLLGEWSPEYKANTSLLNTSFTLNGMSEDAGRIIHLLGEIAFRPRFDERILKQQQQIILREIADNGSNPRVLKSDAANKAFHGEHHPFTRDLFGKQEFIRNVDRDNLHCIHTGAFTAKNASLYVMGPSNIGAIIREELQAVPAGNNQELEVIKIQGPSGPQRLHWSAPEFLNRQHPDESSAYLNLKFIAPGFLSEEKSAVFIMNELLGKGGQSLLYADLRDRRGLCYSISSSYNCPPYNGIISISAAVPAKRIDEAVSAIFNNIERAKETLPDEQSVARIRKNYLYYRKKFDKTLAGSMASFELEAKHGISPEHTLHSIRAVTPHMVQAAARDYLPDVNGNYLLTIDDPLKKE